MYGLTSPNERWSLMQIELFYKCDQDGWHVVTPSYCTKRGAKVSGIKGSCTGEVM